MATIGKGVARRGWPARHTSRSIQKRGCVLQALILASLVGLLSALLLGLVGGAAAAIGYLSIANQLPSPDELQARAASFQSTFITDRNGELLLLYEQIDPHGGRRVKVSLAQVSPWLIKAMVATEDRDFY